MLSLALLPYVTCACVYCGMPYTTVCIVPAMMVIPAMVVADVIPFGQFYVSSYVCYLLAFLYFSKLYCVM